MTSWISSKRAKPRLIAFNAYLSEDGTEVGIVQVHPDVDSMEFHMKLIREHVEHAFAEFLDRDVSTQIYGAISDSALELMRQLAGPVPLTVKPHGVGGSTAPLRTSARRVIAGGRGLQKRPGDDRHQVRGHDSIVLGSNDV